MLRTAILSLLTLTLLVVAACERPEPEAPAAASDRDPVVMTTFYPTTYFTTRLLENTGIPVRNPVPSDADPIFWRPTDEDIAAYQLASLVVTNGAEFEKWVATAALPRTRVVESAAGLDEPFITYQTTTHAHGPEGEHTHEGVDGHTWVDPTIAAFQMATIARALSETFPEHDEVINENALELQADLDALHQRWQSLVPDLQGVTLLASHPAYNYVARRYALDITNLDLDPDTDLTPDAIAEIGAAADASKPVILWWEGEPTEENVARLKDELGVVSVWISPVESLDAALGDTGADYLTLMSDNLDRLTDALKP